MFVLLAGTRRWWYVPGNLYNIIIHPHIIVQLEAKNFLPKIKKDLVMACHIQIIQPLEKAKKQGECH